MVFADGSTGSSADQEITLRDLLAPLLKAWPWLLAVPCIVGAMALGASYLLRPLFTATTTFITPQQQQSATASALASLGAVAGLAGAGGSLRSPAEQYVALLRSEAVTNRLIDSFGLIGSYDVRFRFEARRELERRVRINLGKKDGLISIAVDDPDPARAAAMANAHVDELRRLTGNLALTEAQHRRLFFEGQLKQTRDNLANAQRALESSGFSAGALRAEPKAAAESYARLRAEVTAAEVKLQTLRRAFADNAVEVRQQETLVSALRSQLARLENAADAPANTDYVGKFREFKYQETLFELYARQFELARLDESRESALIQVVDQAAVPEWKSWPKRGLMAVTAAALALALTITWLVGRDLWRISAVSDHARRRPA